uniref:BPTI/Kunitz inhibitor domain-containing protein n=1 Tax=Pseudonaja textilis TaxID=8673 RepID=A0A670ZAR0_PSETE
MFSPVFHYWHVIIYTYVAMNHSGNCLLLLDIFISAFQKRDVTENCKLWARKGKCKGKIPRYYYDVSNKRCQLFIYSGCGGNANNFQTFDECNKACDVFAMLDTCDQPLDVGPCKENFTRFYYDRTTKICKPFKFGGCNGNRNNFLNQEDCMQDHTNNFRVYLRWTICLIFFFSVSPVSPEIWICKLIPEEGRCRDHIPRFYFNTVTGNCDVFIYGGCGGNENNFQTWYECKAACPNSGKVETFNIFLGTPLKQRAF